ncbi:hypothetical protein F5Y18DRAFT_3446 [Xylariaceae sp. FL1019]|nr:hypothetical protein F5Y18DRAFT_3446 [Xylariaceae sp. FL1019]
MKRGEVRGEVTRFVGTVGLLSSHFLFGGFRSFLVPGFSVVSYSRGSSQFPGRRSTVISYPRSFNFPVVFLSENSQSFLVRGVRSHFRSEAFPVVSWSWSFSRFLSEGVSVIACPLYSCFLVMEFQSFPVRALSGLSAMKYHYQRLFSVFRLCISM